MAYLQSKSVDSGSVASASMSFTNVVAAGSAIVVVLRPSLIGATITVTDNQGGTYTVAPNEPLNDGQGDSFGTWVAQNVAGGATTVTVTLSSAGSLRWAIHEYSNIVSAGAVDQEAHSTAINSATPASGSVTAVQNDETIFIAIDQGASGAANATPAAGYTKREQIVVTALLKLATADQVTAVGGSFTSSWTLDASGTALAPLIVTLKGTAPVVTYPMKYTPKGMGRKAVR
jgi:hypothetical protein